MKQNRGYWLGALLAGGYATRLLSPAADAADAAMPDAPEILNVFPASLGPAHPDLSLGRTVVSSIFSPGGSLWGEGLDEASVFQVQMRHEQDQDSSFTLRIGQGGQIYSLRGAFGESVPPSSKHSPWNDEVWQFVTVCEKYNGLRSLLRAGPVPDQVAARFKASPYEQDYFIHNSGAYVPKGSAISSLYCPRLGASFPDGRTYRTVNWGLVPQMRTMHRSPVLYYTQARDMGDGVVELTWAAHNFSERDDVVFDHINAPWGGTRRTSLPVHYVASPQGELKTREDMGLQLMGPQYPHGVAERAVEVRKTGGWNLSCVSDAADSPSLALVFGRDKRLEEELEKKRKGEPFCQHAPSVIKDYLAHAPLYAKGHMWHDWRTRPENTFRNYDVIEMIPRLLLKPGTTIWHRSFLVVNRKDKAIALAKSLVDKVDYGLVAFDPATTPRAPVYIREGKVVEGKAGDRPSFELYSRPTPGTKPVFLIQNTLTGREALTTDPYVFVTREPLALGLPKDHPHHDYYSQAYGYSLDKHNSHWKRLLGFGYVAKPEQGEYKRLSELVDPSLFPKPDAYHMDLWAMPPGDDARKR